jgi:hypothetical protein
MRLHQSSQEPISLIKRLHQSSQKPLSLSTYMYQMWKAYQPLLYLYVPVGDYVFVFSINTQYEISS